MTAIKDISLTALAIKTILISVFGISILPFLSLIAQVLDPNPSFTDSSMYISNGPLLYLHPFMQNFISVLPRFAC